MSIFSMILNIFALATGPASLLALFAAYRRFKDKIFLILFLHILFVSIDYFSGIVIYTLQILSEENSMLFTFVAGSPIIILFIIKIIAYIGAIPLPLISGHLFLGRPVSTKKKIVFFICLGLALIIGIISLFFDTTGFYFFLPLIILHYGVLMYLFILLVSKREEITKPFDKRVLTTLLIGLPLTFFYMVVEDILLFLNIPLEIIASDAFMFTFLTSASLVFSIIYFLGMKTSASDQGDKLNEYCEAYGISDREKEVLPLLLDDLKYKDIGEKLFISLDTVKTHVSRLYKKTETSGKGDLKRHFRNHPNITR